MGKGRIFDRFEASGRRGCPAKAKKAILDDYARHCVDTANPAREMICAVTRGVIQRLATVYADCPGYNPEWRP